MRRTNPTKPSISACGWSAASRGERSACEPSARTFATASVLPALGLRGPRLGRGGSNSRSIPIPWSMKLARHHRRRILDGDGPLVRRLLRPITLWRHSIPVTFPDLIISRLVLRRHGLYLGPRTAPAGVACARGRIRRWLARPRKVEAVSSHFEDRRLRGEQLWRDFGRGKLTITVPTGARRRRAAPFGQNRAAASIQISSRMFPITDPFSTASCASATSSREKTRPMTCTIFPSLHHCIIRLVPS